LYAAAGAGRTRAAEGNNRQENFSPLKSDGPHFSFREKSWRASMTQNAWSIDFPWQQICLNKVKNFTI